MASFLFQGALKDDELRRGERSDAEIQDRLRRMRKPFDKDRY